MSHSLRHALSFGLILGVSPLLADRVCAQAPALPAVPTTTVTDKLPAPPQLASPVDQFRQLLTLAPAERESHLANRPPEIRKRILTKLLQYDAMKPQDRELLLRNTQLQWFLLTFMQTPPTERAAQIAMVPETDRPFVKTHLETWDHLSADQQKEVLKYERVLESMLAQGITNMAVPPPPMAPNVEMVRNLNAFLTLPDDKRQQMYDGFHKFFELSDEERQATMEALPARERMQMNAALKSFDRLPEPQRDRCIRSFAAFSKLSEAQRQEFLKNAGRWREFSAAERQAWRDLVNKTPLLPPLPTEVAFPPPIPRLPVVQATNP